MKLFSLRVEQILLFASDLFEIANVTKYGNWIFCFDCLPASARSGPFAQLPSFSFDRWYVPAATQIDTSPGFSWNDSLARDVLVMTVRRVTSGRPLFHCNSVSRRRSEPRCAARKSDEKCEKRKKPFHVMSRNFRIALCNCDLVPQRRSYSYSNRRYSFYDAIVCTALIFFFFFFI